MIKLSARGKVVGVLDLSSEPMTFVGNADEAARTFCHCILSRMADTTRWRNDQAKALQAVILAIENGIRSRVGDTYTQTFGQAFLDHLKVAATPKGGKHA